MKCQVKVYIYWLWGRVVLETRKFLFLLFYGRRLLCWSNMLIWHVKSMTTPRLFIKITSVEWFRFTNEVDEIPLTLPKRGYNGVINVYRMLSQGFCFSINKLDMGLWYSSLSSCKYIEKIWIWYWCGRYICNKDVLNYWWKLFYIVIGYWINCSSFWNIDFQQCFDSVYS